MDEAAARDQAREARRQKVLARSQGQQRSPIVDLATQQNDISPTGDSADLDEDGQPPLSLADPSPTSQDSGKSASRLAAERRRQKILSKSTERMARVQGDRVMSSKAEDGGGGESLDDVSFGR